MKIDRLIGILSILLKQDQITAPELASKFEVSRRTINRDVEDLCKAGIPIYTLQGAGGGIRIMEDYKIDRSLLTSRDMQVILAGLRSLDSVSGSRYYSQLMEKLQPGSSGFVSGRDSILIDLSSWDKESLAPKIEMIQAAIEERHYLSFRYYSSKGESNRMIEPYYLVFKWSSWYVWGYCLARKDYRMFKLGRMHNLITKMDKYSMREIPIPNLSNDHIYPRVVKAKILFSEEVKWRVVEEFGEHSFTQQDDGKILLSLDYSDKESLLNLLLTFGSKAELLEPDELRLELKKVAQEMASLY